MAFSVFSSWPVNFKSDRPRQAIVLLCQVRKLPVESLGFAHVRLQKKVKYGALADVGGADEKDVTADIRVVVFPMVVHHGDEAFDIEPRPRAYEDAVDNLRLKVDLARLATFPNEVLHHGFLNVPQVLVAVLG